nr:unnamed protein product [Digitaria exilis]
MPGDGRGAIEYEGRSPDGVQWHRLNNRDAGRATGAGRRLGVARRVFKRNKATASQNMAEAPNGNDDVKQTGLEGTRLPLQGGSPGNIRSASSDQQLKQMLDSLKCSKSPAVINYGASWCRVCSQILPSFCKFSNEFKNLTFIYADIDECPETTQSIRYTPTFHFYRGGERVDEMLGTGEERLHDRLWLHS